MIEQTRCLSGGATGADLVWGRSASLRGDQVTHFSFARHHTVAPVEQLHCLSDALLAEADAPCHLANQSLKRHIPPLSNYVGKLLRRNWFQVRDASSCYAVSSIKNGQVQGGTAYAVQMCIDKPAACTIYLFDQEECYWLRWDEDHWQRIYEPPAPQGVWAGIGTRRLNYVGRLAIHVLMDRHPIKDIAWRDGTPRITRVAE